MDLSGEDMNFAISHFILEIRKKSGAEYPAETLYDIVICLQLYMAMNGKVVKILDEVKCGQIHNTLDNHMKELSHRGYVKPRVQACIITIEEEELLWKSGILGSDTPKQLVETLLYLFGLHFALCAGAEHRSCRVSETSQLKVHFDNNVGLYYLEYCEDTSKTNQGGLDNHKVNRKMVGTYENKQNSVRCVVSMYNHYMSVRPTGPKCPDDFYLRPLPAPKGLAILANQGTNFL